MEEYIFQKLEYYFNSNQFNIATQTILNLQAHVGKWMKYGNTGAIIYGRPRVGKTRAILYITRELQENIVWKTVSTDKGRITDNIKR